MIGTAQAADDPPPTSVPDSVLSIPEIRDYQRINAELVQRLDEGQKHVRLVGAERQRLLLAEISGTWAATVEIEGETGPELAAALDAPGLTVVARGPAADGAARGFRSGCLILLGTAGDALGYCMEGGSVLANAGAGHRAGLDQRGGVLWIRGPIGRLAGERQSGGRLFVSAQHVGPHTGHGHRGGTMLQLPHDAEARPDFGIDPSNAEFLRTFLHKASPWLSNSRAADARA